MRLIFETLLAPITSRIARPILVSILPFVACMPQAHGGWIEDRDGRTIIHVKLFNLPDPSNTDTYNRAEVGGVRAFARQFPKLFAEKYRAKYGADPAKYGRHNWDNVEVQLEEFSGIQVEGVETDLLAIAGGM